MAIYAPGHRDRHNRPNRGGKRKVIAMLSLTAMVDMFTVLAVFLLQNYQTTGEVIELSDEVQLPKAHAVKELKPAHVVVIGFKDISLDKKKVADTPTVKAQEAWEIATLVKEVQDSFRLGEEKSKLLGLDQIKKAVDQTKSIEQRPAPEDLRRVTVQADKGIDFLTIKKVMFTLYQAGASEINFAVMKDEKKVAK